MIRYYGQENTPGAPGNFLANQGPSTPVKFDERMNQLVPTLGGGGIKKDSVRWKNTPTEFPQAFGMFPGMQVAGNPSFDIQQGPGALGRRSGEQLQRLYQGGTQQNQQLNEELIRRGLTPGGGPQLPLANANIFTPFQVAQALPGEAGNLGGMLTAPPGGMQDVEQGPPIRFGADIEDGKIQNLRGGVNAQLDANQRINFGGNYNLQNQSGRLNVGYQTPTFGFDVNVNRNPKGYGAGLGGTVRW